ncbi:MAG: two component transcriptional regulator, winged helix family [Anaerospora sp.]|nr:two component transcriptional regulator, winged helix family [Anaerospora sp.]
MGLEGELSYGTIVLNNKVRDGLVENNPLGLTTKEFEVLEFFILNQGQILTREQIFDRIWGFDSDTVLSIVDLYVHYLRKKLAPYKLDTIIQTVRGAGFMLKEK